MIVRQTSFVIVAVTLFGCGMSQTKDPASSRKQLQDPNVLVERGRAFAEAGDFTRAEQYLSSALANGADPHVALPPLLRACVEGGHLRLAAEYAEAQLVRDPADAHLRFLAGALQAQVGSPVEARRHLQRAADEMKKDAEVQFAVAAFFRDHLNDKIAADPYFRAYLDIAPRGAHAAEARASVMELVQ